MREIKYFTHGKMEVVLKREEATNGVLAYANTCRYTKLFTNVCVKAGNKGFHVHRLILSFYSGRFKAIFSEQSEENTNNLLSIVELNDERVDATSLESLIDFIYSGKININQENVASLLATSDYLQIDDTKQYCFKYLESNISAKTCGKVLKIADMYQNVTLLSKSLIYICSNIRKITPPDEFKLISKRHLLEFVAKLNEEHIEQRFIYDVIIKWVEFTANRKEVFAELFQCLDLRKLPLSDLENTVSNEILVKDNRFCLNLVMEAMKSRQHGFSNATKVLSIGGEHTRNEVFNVYRHDGSIYSTLPQAVDTHCSLKLDGFVYYIRGWRVVSTSDKVWRIKLNKRNMK